VLGAWWRRLPIADLKQGPPLYLNVPDGSYIAGRMIWAEQLYHFCVEKYQVVNLVDHVPCVEQPDRDVELSSYGSVRVDPVRVVQLGEVMELHDILNARGKLSRGNAGSTSTLVNEIWEIWQALSWLVVRRVAELMCEHHRSHPDSPALTNTWKQIALLGKSRCVSILKCFSSAKHGLWCSVMGRRRKPRLGLGWQCISDVMKDFQR